MINLLWISLFSKNLNVVGIDQWSGLNSPKQSPNRIKHDFNLHIQKFILSCATTVPNGGMAPRHSHFTSVLRALRPAIGRDDHPSIRLEVVRGCQVVGAKNAKKSSRGSCPWRGGISNVKFLGQSLSITPRMRLEQKKNKTAGIFQICIHKNSGCRQVPRFWYLVQKSGSSNIGFRVGWRIGPMDAPLRFSPVAVTLEQCSHGKIFGMNICHFMMHGDIEKQLKKHIHPHPIIHASMLWCMRNAINFKQLPQKNMCIFWGKWILGDGYLQEALISQLISAYIHVDCCFRLCLPKLSLFKTIQLQWNHPNTFRTPPIRAQSQSLSPLT